MLCRLWQWPSDCRQSEGAGSDYWGTFSLIPLEQQDSSLDLQGWQHIRDLWHSWQLPHPGQLYCRAWEKGACFPGQMLFKVIPRSVAYICSLNMHSQPPVISCWKFANSWVCSCSYDFAFILNNEMISYWLASCAHCKSTPKNMGGNRRGGEFMWHNYFSQMLHSSNSRTSWAYEPFTHQPTVVLYFLGFVWTNAGIVSSIDGFLSLIVGGWGTSRQPGTLLETCLQCQEPQS